MKELVKNNELLHTHTQNGLVVGQRDMDCFPRTIKTLSEHFKKKKKRGFFLLKIIAETESYFLQFFYMASAWDFCVFVR